MNYSAKELPQCIAIAVPTLQMEEDFPITSDEKWSSVVMGTNKLSCSVFIICTTMLFAGCASGPTRDVSSIMPPTNPIESVAGLGKQAKAWSTGLVDSLQNQLKTGTAEKRAVAAQELGVFAKSNERGSFRAIEMLTKAMQRDEDMSVRVAATDALGGIQDENSSKYLDALVPTQGFASSEDLNVRAPQMSFLGGLFRR